LQLGFLVRRKIIASEPKFIANVLAIIGFVPTLIATGGGQENPPILVLSDFYRRKHVASQLDTSGNRRFLWLK